MAFSPSQTAVYAFCDRVRGQPLTTSPLSMMAESYTHTWVNTSSDYSCSSQKQLTNKSGATDSRVRSRPRKVERYGCRGFIHMHFISRAIMRRFRRKSLPPQSPAVKASSTVDSWKPQATAGNKDSDLAGEYLTASTSGPSWPKLSFGAMVDQGPRMEMEDEICVVEDVQRGFLYAGVFDGHCGGAAAKYLRDELYLMCRGALEDGYSWDKEDLASKGLTNAFLQTDVRLLDWLDAHPEQSEQQSGSTATVIFVRMDRILVAHVGDSRVVLCRGGNPVELCGDHRPFGSSPTAIAEIKRITAAGGWVSHGRLCGSLAVSRAFGDSPYKRHRGRMLEEGLRHGRWTKKFVTRLNLRGDWLTAEPEISYTDLVEDDEFVILASDGLWDVVKSDEAVRFVRKGLLTHGNVQKVTEQLLCYAVQERNGHDNISIVIVDLGKIGKKKYVTGRSSNQSINGAT